MADHSATPLLDMIRLPRDLRQLPPESLRQVADELRRETVDAVSVTGGHLGAGLGVIELTVALHYVFDTPYDKLIWDVGHQAYPHKILTGRRDRIRTLRQGGGLSGFTRRAESEYDPFGAAPANPAAPANAAPAPAAASDDPFGAPAAAPANPAAPAKAAPPAKSDTEVDPFQDDANQSEDPFGN